MAVYFLPEDDILEVGLCHRNRMIEKTLYVIAIVITLLALVSQLLKINRLSQFKRLWPILLAFLLAIGGSFYRLLYPEQALFGVDILFSALIAGVFLLNLLASLLFFDKYVEYLIKRLSATCPTRTTGKQSAQAKSLKRAKRFRDWKPIVIVYDILTYNLLWISALLVKYQQHREGLLLLRFAFGMSFLRTSYILALSEIVLSQIAVDIKQILQFQTEFMTQSNNTVGMSENQRNQKNKLAKLLPKTIRLRKVIFVFAIQWYITGFLPSVWPFLLYQFSYLIPVFQIIWSVINLFAMQTSRKKKVKKEAKKSGSLALRKVSNSFEFGTDKASHDYENLQKLKRHKPRESSTSLSGENLEMTMSSSFAVSRVESGFTERGPGKEENLVGMITYLQNESKKHAQTQSVDKLPEVGLMEGTEQLETGIYACNDTVLQEQAVTSETDGKPDKSRMTHLL